MNKSEADSQEFSTAERAMLQNFVVPEPAARLEDQLMTRLQLQRQAQAPRQRNRPRWWRWSALGLGAALVAAAAVLWFVEVDSPSPPVTEIARPAPGEQHSQKPPVLPGASRPQTTWVLRGSAPESYVAIVDPDVKRNGRATRSLRSTEPSVGFGTWMRNVDPRAYRGKRVRLSAFVRSDAVEGWAGLWMRVDGEDKYTAFDNMSDRAITATTAWTKYEVVLDVAEAATNVAYGILLSGTGATWIDEVDLEVVADDVAVTGSISTEHDVNGWQLRGSAPHEYETGLDPQRERDGKASRFLRSGTAATHEFGTWMTGTDASIYRGKRVRLSAWVRADTVEDWAGLWMRVDPAAEVAFFDNMSRRPITGTSEWTRYEVVLDITETATHIGYGALLTGKGAIWLDDVKLEPVSSDVPVTADQGRDPASALMRWFF